MREWSLAWMTTSRPRVIVPRVRARTPSRRVSRDRESSRQHHRRLESEEGSPSTWQLAPAPKRSQRPALTAPVAHRPGAAAAPPFVGVMRLPVAAIAAPATAMARLLRFARRRRDQTPEPGYVSAGAPATSQITALVYELLDAHADTTQLAAGLEQDLLWSAHLDYLRALQRLGREALAQLPPDTAS
jgi:hypothetical protein